MSPTSRRPDKQHATKADRLDLQILTALCAGGRDTVTELSKQVGLSSTPLNARVQRMESAGIILGYRAEIDLEQLAGCSPYCVMLALVSPTSAQLRSVESLILACPYIVRCEALQGSLHYVFWVYARSIQHYLDIMAPFRAYELDYTTHPISRHVARPSLHRLVAELARATDL